jgi:hypothetical protein
MSEDYWKTAFVAAIGCLHLTIGWGRLNAWSTITGTIMLLLLLSIPWRSRVRWSERAAYAATFGLAVTLAFGRLFEDRFDPDLFSRSRQILIVWAVLSSVLFVARSLPLPSNRE